MGWPGYRCRTALQSSGRHQVLTGLKQMRTIDLVSTGQGSTGCVGQSGCSSGVEHHVANVIVVGSNPITRSIFS